MKVPTFIISNYSSSLIPRAKYGSSVRLQTLRRLGLCLIHLLFILSCLPYDKDSDRYWAKVNTIVMVLVLMELIAQQGSLKLNEYTNKSITTNYDKCCK